MWLMAKLFSINTRVRIHADTDFKTCTYDVCPINHKDIHNHAWEDK